MQRSSGCGNGRRVRRSDETDADEEENVEERPPSGEPRKRNTHMNEVVVRVVGNGADVCVWGVVEGEKGERGGGSVGRLSDGCVRARVWEVVEGGGGESAAGERGGRRRDHGRVGRRARGHWREKTTAQKEGRTWARAGERIGREREGGRSWNRKLKRRKRA